VIEITLPAFSISRRRLFERLSGSRQELAIIALVTLVAAIPRLAMLTSIPAGLHGDEAWTGIDAQRILDHGLIGPYVHSALGQPAGPLYFAAPFVAVFGHTVFSIRFAMAVLGVATIPCAYGAFRLMFNRNVGAFAALLLAVSVWHVHYSRIAFMVISWPLAEMIALLLFFLALRTQRWLHFAAAGLTLGLGVYTYNAYPVFLIGFGVLVAWAAAFHQPDLRKYGQQIGLLALVGLVAAVPLLLYISDSKHDYTAHHKLVSVFETTEWKTTGTTGHIDILWDNTRLFVNDGFWSGTPDFADGAGSQAMIDRVSLGLLVIGIGMALWSIRRPSYMALLTMIVLLPVSTVVTTQGTYRQTLGIVPFLAALEALPLAFVWGRAQRFGPMWRSAAMFVVAATFAAITFFNMNFYFSKFPDSGVAQYTFGHEYTDAVEYIVSLPGNPYVYLYSNRWGFNYETRLYLGPNLHGEDRSMEFGKPDHLNLENDRTRDVVYMFMGSYMSMIDEVQRLYPGGTAIERTSKDRGPEFRAYYLPMLKPRETPPIPLPTFEPTPTLTPRPGGADRDRARLSDLQRVQQALEAYKRKHGSYPGTGGGVQTLCVYKDEDVGCKLKEFLPDIPVDPLGEPTTTGYFYSSDGKTYTIYAERETETAPGCPDHPEHLAQLGPLMCVKGP
jgi:4-amino-4-deoxy-L-arabinose transferase-like glycosyltransferase